MKAELKFDQIIINDKKFSTSNFEKTIEKAVSDIRTDLTKKISRGQDAEGRKVRDYSPGYIAAIKAGKVQSEKGRAKKRTTKTNLRITGDLLGSRQIRRIKGGAEMGFSGQHYSGQSNAELAENLHKRGFTGWHTLGDKHKKLILKGVGKRIGELMAETLKIRKNT